MSSKFWSVVALSAAVLFACDPGVNKNEISFWVVEGGEGVQYVESLVEEFVLMKQETNPEFEINVSTYWVEDMREDFATSSLAGNPPDLVWTVSDHAGPFVNANLILPLEEEIDFSKYLDNVVDSVRIDGSVWGVPIDYGNHLMLMYNKRLVPNPPRTTDELIEIGSRITRGDRYGLVFNQTEPYYFLPWLGGFGGSVFAEDGITGTLNTEGMIEALTFIQSLKFDSNILPVESDHNVADTLFKEGQAGMIINGDWALGEYYNILGDDLGVARIPQVSETGLWPSPYAAGKFFMLPRSLQRQPEKKVAILEFIEFVTNYENQDALLQYLNRLPALKERYQSPLSEDPVKNAVLEGSLDQLQVSIPAPGVTEMRYNYDAMRPWLARVMNNQATPREAALSMQKDMESIRESR